MVLVFLHWMEVDLVVVVVAEGDNLRMVGLRSEDGDVGGDLVDGRILPVLLLDGGHAVVGWDDPVGLVRVQGRRRGCLIGSTSFCSD